MASRQAVLLMAATAAAIAVAFLPTPASAEVYTVGDDARWTLKYPASWTDGKTFKVGDTLTFTYPAGKHTVVEVSGADFKDCNSQGNKLNTWVTGNDSVSLDKVGRRWFVCGVGNHCALGMKLLVNVTDGGSPSSPSSATSLVSGAVAAAGAAVVAAVLMY